MLQSSEVAISWVIDFLLQQLTQQLHINHLVKLAPQFTYLYPHRILQASILATDPMQDVFNQNITQDIEPPSTPIDNFANFIMTNADADERKSIVNADAQTQVYTQRNSKPNDLSLQTYSNFGERKSNIRQYFKIPQPQTTTFLELPKAKLTPQEEQQEEEVRNVQKRLYYTRKMTKMYAEEERKRLEAIKNRKSPQLPKNDFTFCFDGHFLTKKPKKFDQFSVQQLRMSESTNQKMNKKEGSGEIDQQKSMWRTRSFRESNYKKLSIFNNHDKRQVSHLPFIKMTDNAKFDESSKTSRGKNKEILTLKKFTQTNQHRGFKHYNEIQKQKRQRQLMKNSRLEDTEDYFGDKSGLTQEKSHGSHHRQSYLMQKYLKKIKQQYPDEQIRKSLNFDPTSYPKNDPVHRYYKHNFNNDRRVYESKLIEEVIDI